MLNILESISDATTSIDTLVQLFNTLRPKRPAGSAQAIANVRTLTRLLKADPAHARALRDYVL
eukprot:gene38164-47114_t